MAFEGSEKKMELMVKGHDLFKWADKHATPLVQACGARILKRLVKPKLQSYLLSESSLFIWPDRLLMISCGRTQLVRSVLYALQNINIQNIECLLFERKNEFFPTDQLSDFKSDHLQIENQLQQHQLAGKAWRFGYRDEHHLHLYHTHKNYTPAPNEHTLELLMYNLPPERSAPPKKPLIDGFQVCEHFFQPHGYSLNAVRNDEYYTLHMSPEPDSPYVSFETNARHPKAQNIVPCVLKALQPSSFDIIYFSPKGQGANKLCANLSNFKARSRFQQSLSCGFELCYEHWFEPSQQALQGVPL